MTSIVFGVGLGIQRSFQKHQNVFLNTFGKQNRNLIQKSKIRKIIKNHAQNKNWKFWKSGTMLSNHDIWYEMDPFDALDMFRNHFDHPNLIRNDFEKNENFRFFEFFICGSRHKNLKFYRLGCKKAQKIIKIHRKVFGAPPKNFCRDNSS